MSLPRAFGRGFEKIGAPPVCAPRNGQGLLNILYESSELHIILISQFWKRSKSFNARGPNVVDLDRPR